MVCNKNFNEAAPSHTYGKGRTCKMEGCVATLSQYNPESYCHVHWAQVAREEDQRCQDEYDFELDVEYRKCAKCGEQLPLTGAFFGRDQTLTSGFRHKCKLCLSEEQKEYRHRKREGRRVIVSSMFRGKRTTSVMELDA